MPEEKLKFECHCGQHLVAPRSMVGKRVHCPSCGRQLAVPRSGHAVDLTLYSRTKRYPVMCPCGYRMFVKAAAADHVLRCPECKRAMRVPSGKVLTGSETPVLRPGKKGRDYIDTDDLILLVDDEEGPGADIG